MEIKEGRKLETNSSLPEGKLVPQGDKKRLFFYVCVDPEGPKVILEMKSVHGPDRPLTAGYQCLRSPRLTPMANAAISSSIFHKCLGMKKYDSWTCSFTCTFDTTNIINIRFFTIFFWDRQMWGFRSFVLLIYILTFFLPKL